MQLNSFIPEKHKLSIVLLSAVTLFVLLSLLLGLPSRFTEKDFIFPDVNSYMQAADLLYHHHFTPHYARPIGYAIILGIPYLFNTAASLQTLLVCSLFINIVAWLGSVYLVYKIGQRWFDSRTAFIAAICFVFMVSNILMTYQAMTETIFIYLLLLSINHILAFIQTQKHTHLLIAFFSFCYTAITRPVNYNLCWIFLLICIWLCRKNWKHILLTIFIFVITIGLQFYIIHRQYGLNKISIISSYTLYHYLGTKVENPSLQAVDYDATLAIREKYAMVMALKDSALHRGKSVYPYLDKAYNKAIEYQLRQNTANVLRVWLHNMYDNSKDGSSIIQFLNKDSNPYSLFSITKKGILFLTLAQNIVLSFLCIINALILSWWCIFKRALYSKDMLFAGILQLLTLYYILTAGVSAWQGDRFSYIWYTFVILVTTYIYKTFKRGKQAI